MIFSLATCTLAALLFLNSRKIAHLFFWYVIAVALGWIIPFGFLISWVIMVMAPHKEDHKPPANSFDKAFGKDDE
jgi:hypothetical protein